MCVHNVADTRACRGVRPHTRLHLTCKHANLCSLQATLMMPDSGLGGGVLGNAERSITQMSLEPGSERVVCYIKFGPVFMLNTQLAKVGALCQSCIL